jgi:nucleoside-diphosphate-sugar epimerase
MTLHLFARRPQQVIEWLRQNGIVSQAKVGLYDTFGEGGEYFAVINFVGVGDPARALSMGAEILDLTNRFDSLAMDYVRRHPSCRYLFTSSGAAYGSRFEAPVDENSLAAFPINALGSDDWYGMAKAHAECRHRAHPALRIVDIRIFNYVSQTQDLSARFLITEAIRAIRDQSELQTSASPTVRDYLHASDFCALVDAVLAAPPTNDVVDCYSKAPVEKTALLQALQDRFGLVYAIAHDHPDMSATGYKPCYYSLNRRAGRFGYAPKFSSVSGVLDAAAAMLGAGA